MDVYLIRKQRGASLVETAASMVILLPLIVMVLFVVLEASQAYLIKEGLSNGARQAARDLSVIYGQDAQIQFSRSQQDNLVFSQVHLNNIINNAAQFDDPTWNTGGIPPTVT